MAQEKQFIKQKIRMSQIEEFLSTEFSRAGYSHSLVQRTPLALRITVFAHKPGIVIGRGGKNIESMTQILKEKFGLENPQLEVQEVENPDLDARIVSKQIAAAIERGLNYKRIANLTLQRVMDAGAVGVAIRVSGKLGGEMSRIEKFSAGYLKYAGETAENLDRAYARAQVKLGTVGIQVRIMKEEPKEIGFKRMLAKKISEEAAAEKKTEAAPAEPQEKAEEPQEKAPEAPAEAEEPDIPEEDALAELEEEEELETANGIPEEEEEEEGPEGVIGE